MLDADWFIAMRYKPKYHILWLFIMFDDSHLNIES